MPFARAGLSSGQVSLNRNQATVEAFARSETLPRFVVTPSLQVLIDPALNDESATVLFFDIRLRAALQRVSSRRTPG
jgi:hypothetical protein